MFGILRQSIISSSRRPQLQTSNTLSFDGTDDRVLCDDDPAFEQQTPTLEFWAYHNNQARTNDGGVGKGEIFGDERQVSYIIDFSDGGASASISDGSGSSTYGFRVNNSINAQIWTHWAMTYDESTLKLYKNGNIIGTLDISITIQNLNGDFSQFAIGARSFDSQTSRCMDGNIAEVRVWNYVRSQSEIINNANTKLTGDESGLVAYFPIDEGIGTTIIDNAGTNDGTIHGATWVERDSFPNLVTSFNDLFANSEFGAWYDPSDITTLWQDTNGTTQVSATGQSVARIDDKSGNGLHLTQSTSSLQPTYQEDGSGIGHLLFTLDQYVLSNTFTTTLTESGSAIWKGSNQNSNELGWALTEYLVATTDKRIAYCIDTRSSPRRHTTYGPRGSSFNIFIDLDTELDTSVHTLIYNDQGTTSVGFVDGQQQSSTITSNETFEAGDRRIVLGIRSDLNSTLGLFTGTIYQVVMLNRPLTENEIIFSNDSLK